MRIILLAIVLTIIIHTVYSAETYPLQEIASDIAKLEKTSTNLTSKERAESYSEIFEHYKPTLSSSNIQRLSDEQLFELSKLLHHISFYTENPHHVSSLTTVIIELADRGYTKIYPLVLHLEEVMVSTRMFAELEELKTRFNSIDFKSNANLKVKATRMDGPTIISAKKGNLVREAFAFGKYDIIVVSHPYCHFSNNARAFINSDDALFNIFIEYSTWLIPPAGNFYLNKVEEVNANENLPFAYFYKMSEFPEIESWDTPSFYFYKDGQLKFSFSGWPKEGNHENLIEGLQSLKLQTDTPY